MERGYVRLYRKINDSGLYQLPKTLALFIYLLLHVTHKPRKIGTPHGIFQLQPGQLISGRIELARALKQSEMSVRVALKNLKNAEIITIRSTSKFSVFTLINWAKYQTPEATVTSSVTNRQPTDNQQTTTKQEVKNVRTTPLGAGAPGFGDFWSLYPKKRGKGDAEEIWKRKKLNQQGALVLEALKKAMVSKQWRKEDGKFIPHPARWLKSEGWHDQEAVDLPPPAAPAKKTVAVIETDPALQAEADALAAQNKKRWLK